MNYICQCQVKSVTVKVSRKKCNTVTKRQSKKEVKTKGDIMCGAYHIMQSCQNVQRSEENDKLLEGCKIPRAGW